MAVEVTMPKLGLTMEQGTVLNWNKGVGDPVETGEVLLIIQTDKVEFEVEAPAGGTVLKLLANEGDVVPTGEVIAFIGEAGEEVDVAAPAPPATAAPEATTADVAAGRAAPEAPPPGDGRIAISPVAKKLAAEMGVDVSTLEGSGPGGRIVKEDVLKAAEGGGGAAPAAAPAVTPVAPRRADGRIFISPLARRLAKERGIDPARIQGSGPKGRIIKDDILRAARAGPGIPAFAPPPPPAAPGGILESIAVRGMREVIGRRMAQSWSAAPHVTEVIDVDVSRIVDMRESNKEGWVTLFGVKVTYNDIFVHQVSRAIRRYPKVNSRLNGDVIEVLGDVNIGVAVNVEGGLMVPVIRNADQKDVGQIARETRDLADRAKDGRITPDALEGATFTITNLGGYGIQMFTPIIDLPNSCILGIGKITPTPVVVEGEIDIRDIVYLSLSFDHRIVDGAPAAEFLSLLKGMLEKPVVVPV